MLAELDRHGGLWNLVRKTVRLYNSHGVSGLKHVVRKKMAVILHKPAVAPEADYRCYYETYMEHIVGARTKSPEFVPRRPDLAGRVPTPVKLIAYYLPQFHPFPENDRWWGEGFTEWTNVTKAQPHFVGHYQPRLPADLGFYDLRVPEVQRQQIEMAKQYGIYGFCYYYYWFSGKRLMEKPLRQFLENDGIDMPFCISWANENWTRRWDGFDQEILIKQEYAPEDELSFIRDVAPIMQDRRYIRIAGKPLIIVYNIHELPAPRRAVDVWRHYCREAGVGNIFVAATIRLPGLDPRDYGCDAAIQFPPAAMELVMDAHKQKFLYPGHQGGVWDYRRCIDEVAKSIARKSDFPVFHGAMPSWDNTARRPDGKGFLFTHACPGEYFKWLRLVCEHTEQEHPAEEKLVFINAWNEWAEGAYLEPDRRYGYANLEATARVMEIIEAGRSNRALEDKGEGCIGS